MIYSKLGPMNLTERLDFKWSTKDYWRAKVESQLYLLGIGFPREHYYYKVLPKMTIKTLSKFWHKYEAICHTFYIKKQKAYFKDANGMRSQDWPSIRKANSIKQKAHTKLVKELLG